MLYFNELDILKKVEAYTLLLLPSPLRRKDYTPISSGTRTRTAYLDGLRGLGAILVFLEHFTIPARHGLVGADSIQLKAWPVFQYPIFRLFYDGGGFAVALFFLTSGYALSRKPMCFRQDYSTGASRIEPVVRSSIFRRGIRIFLPAIAVALATMPAAYFGAFDWRAPRLEYHAIGACVPIRHSKFSSQLLDLIKFVASNLIYPYMWLGEIDGVPRSTCAMTTTYGYHLWTIPVEFWSSQLLFLCLLSLLPFRRTIRISCMFSMACYCFWCKQLEVGLFLTGAVLCDLDVGKTSFKWEQQEKKKGVLVQILLCTLCVFGLWVGSMSRSQTGVTPGLYLFSSITPSDDFWIRVGALTVFWTVSQSSWLQSPFNSSIMQYLGRISFSFYLVHGSIVSSAGWRLEYLILTSDDYSSSILHVFLWLCCILFLAIVVWVGDIFWRAVDQPSIQLAKYLDRKLLM